MDATTRSKEDPIFSYRLGTKEEIYSPIEQRYNLKPTFVYCQYCKYYIQTDLANAKCKKCDSNLIVLLPRMNHNNEQLAGSTS